jgi:two-component system, OmpR family, response regulator VicR
MDSSNGNNDASAGSVADREDPRAGAPRILIVDDEVQVAHALRRIFSRAGFVVEVAQTCDDALAKLGPFAPNVVLSDFRMPGMDGGELLSEVRARAPHTLRYVISGYADIAPIRRSLNDGVIHAILHKPWDMTLPRDVLDRLARQKAAKPE